MACCCFSVSKCCVEFSCHCFVIRLGLWSRLNTRRKRGCIPCDLPDCASMSSNFCSMPLPPAFPCSASREHGEIDRTSIGLSCDISASRENRRIAALTAAMLSRMMSLCIATSLCSNAGRAKKSMLLHQVVAGGDESLNGDIDSSFFPTQQPVRRVDTHVIFHATGEVSFFEGSSQMMMARSGEVAHVRLVWYTSRCLCSNLSLFWLGRF
jgi:hypothetical protein